MTISGQNCLMVSRSVTSHRPTLLQFTFDIQVATVAPWAIRRYITHDVVLLHYDVIPRQRPEAAGINY